MYHRVFLKALKNTLGIEGVYSINPKDPGGETFMGISRVYWPKWGGWKVIDAWDKKSAPPDLFPEIAEFYHTNFWCTFQGDKVADLSEAVAVELFDTGVNLGVGPAVGCLQRALNIQNNYGKLFPDLDDDGGLGKITFGTLLWYLTEQFGTFENNERILLNCMNGEQYILYKNNPKHEGFRGWFLRVS
jgi:lysozyme family protein